MKMNRKLTPNSVNDKVYLLRNKGGKRCRIDRKYRAVKVKLGVDALKH